MNLNLLLDMIRERGYTPELAPKDENDTAPLENETLIIHGKDGVITWEITYAELRTMPDKLWDHAVRYRLPEAQ